MDIEGEYEFTGPPEAVWDLLHDPAVLMRCIPGCQSLQRLDAARYTCEVQARYGPVKATFETRLEVRDAEHPHVYTLVGQGQGGPAGFGQGSARVHLVPSARGTLLRYRATVAAGGRLARLGARLMRSSVTKLVERFFDRFKAVADEALRGE